VANQSNLQQPGG